MKPDDIDTAVAKGIITPEQAQALKDEAAGDPGAKEEPFTLVDNYGAVFVVVGLLILQSAPRLLSGVLSETLQPLLFGGFAAVYWALAEGLVRGRRRLPATVAAFLFVYNATSAVWLLSKPAPVPDPVSEIIPFWFPNLEIRHLAAIAVFLALALARFRLPLLVLGLALALLALAMSLFVDDTPGLWIMAGCGLAAILIGILLDLRDPTRTGPWHEWAMWLFVIGSPLLVHPMFVTLILDVRDVGLYNKVGLVLGLAFVVSFIGLLLDRRSLVGSCLIYLAGSFAYLLEHMAGNLNTLLGIVPLIIGAYVIVLGVAWRPIRRGVLGALPGQAWLRHLPRYS